MAHSSVQSVTSAPVSPRVERVGRTRRYLVMMGIRTACFLAAFAVEGPLRWACIVGAVVLPYVAVVLANAVGPRGVAPVAGISDPHVRQLGPR